MKFPPTKPIATMTRNQIIKQIESARKKAEKASKNVEMYITHRDNAIAKANAKGIQVSTADFHIENPDANYPSIALNDANAFDFSVVYPIMNAWEYALTNAKTASRENRQIEHLTKRLAEIDNDIDRYANLAELMESVMVDFKKEWFNKMELWHANRHAQIQPIIPATKERMARLKSIIERMKAQYGWISVTHRFHHTRTYNAIQKAIRDCNDILMDKAATLDYCEYMAWASEAIANDWKRSMDVFVRKLERFNINFDTLFVHGIDVTPKGFECVITENRNRHIYARMIWAAEYSVMVSPHTRYIITERKSL